MEGTSDSFPSTRTTVCRMEKATSTPARTPAGTRAWIRPAPKTRIAIAATTRPAAVGSACSRRAPSSAPSLRSPRVMIGAAAEPNHGATRARPTSTSTNDRPTATRLPGPPSRTVARASQQSPSPPRPTANGTSRITPARRTRARRVTPRGETLTRRRLSSAAPTAKRGAATRMAMASPTGGAMSEENHRYPPSRSPATTGRRARNRIRPSVEPSTAPSPLSTAASTRTWLGVPPTNLIAARRRSREAAERRVLVATKTRMGTSSPRTPIRIRSFRPSGMGRFTERSSPNETAGGASSASTAEGRTPT